MNRGIAVVVALTCGGLVPLGAQRLADAVPDDAFLYYRYDADAAPEWNAEIAAEVWGAIHEADFPGFLLREVAPQLAGPEDVEALEQLWRLAQDTMSRVPWQAMGEHEVLFALRQHQVTERHAQHQVLFGCRVDPEAIVGVHDGLRHVLDVLHQLNPDLRITAVVDDGETRREFSDPAAVLRAARELGSDRALTYRVSHTAGGKWSEAREQTLASLLFDGPRVVLALAPGADVLTEQCHARMHGEKGALTDAPQFRSAFAGLPGGYEHFFFDMDAMLGAIGRALEVAEKEMSAVGMSPLDGRVKSKNMAMFLGWYHAIDLLGCYDSIATVRRSEGTRAIKEQVARFKDIELVADNPLYQMSECCVTPGAASLLDFVPADASSFALHQGFDLAPLYRYAMDLAVKYVPEMETEILPVWKAGQALLGIDVEKQLLPLIGSPSVQIMLPAADQGGLGGEHFVWITRPVDLALSRDLTHRFTALGESLLPLAMRKLKERMQELPFSIDVAIEPNDGMFRSLNRFRFRFQMGPLGFGSQVLFGHVGPLSVMGTSEDSIAYVLETYSGEHETVRDAGPLVDAGMNDDRPWSSVTMLDRGKQMEGIAMGLRQGANSMGWNMQLQHMPPEARAAVTGVRGLMTRVAGIVAQMDFVGHEVSGTWVDESGAVRMRTVTDYRLPEKPCTEESGIEESTSEEIPAHDR